MLERGLLGGVPYTQAIANRPALHQDDRLMAVFSGRRRREANDVPGLDLLHDLFKSECRDVMALVHDDMAILGDEILDFPLPLKALDHGHVNDAGTYGFATADLTDRLDR